MTTNQIIDRGQLNRLAVVRDTDEPETITQWLTKVTVTVAIATNHDRNRIEAIKHVRNQCTDMGLLEAKRLIEGEPLIGYYDGFTQATDHVSKIMHAVAASEIGTVSIQVEPPQYYRVKRYA